MLRVIAETYSDFYDGISFNGTNEIINPISLAEYKADFDMALDAIGRGEWHGTETPLSDLRGFGKLQRAVIALILNIPDHTLIKYHNDDMGKLRAIGFSMMRRFLNGEYYERRR